MGARANFVIIRKGIAAIYYDQWAALDCPILLADGPAEAAKFAETLEQVDGLMDAVWAEGGFLLDFDKILTTEERVRIAEVKAKLSGQEAPASA